MRTAQLVGMLICVLICIGCSETQAPQTPPVPPAPLPLTPEQKKVVALAQEHLEKSGSKWKMPIEVKEPPNRVSKRPDWKKHVEDEKHIWVIVYHTPKEELDLGPRLLYVNVRTNEVLLGERK